MADRIAVQVCYATPTGEILRTLMVEEGTTIEQALQLSDLAGIDPSTHTVGIWNKKKPLDTVLRDHDRIEIYRPLQADPKEARRRRVGGAPVPTSAPAAKT